MNESDDTTVLAFAYVRDGVNLPNSVEEGFNSIPRSPLAVIIDRYLRDHPRTETAPLLRRIADLNQGRLEDLNAPAFLSYLVAKCASDEVQIRSLVNTIRTYDSVLNAASDGCDGELLIAARAEDDDAGATVTIDNLREQMGRRIR